MSNIPRYYLHGDEAEDSPETYYCKNAIFSFSKITLKNHAAGKSISKFTTVI